MSSHQVVEVEGIGEAGDPPKDRPAKYEGSRSECERWISEYWREKPPGKVWVIREVAK